MWQCTVRGGVDVAFYVAVYSEGGGVTVHVAMYSERGVTAHVAAHSEKGCYYVDLMWQCTVRGGVTVHVAVLSERGC